MSANIVWSINQLECNPNDEGKTNVVTAAHWECIGVKVVDSKTYTFKISSVTGFVLDPTAEFIEYSSLNQDQILSWIWELGLDKATVEQSVQDQIDAQIRPSIVYPELPWAST